MWSRLVVFVLLVLAAGCSAPPAPPPPPVVEAPPPVSEGRRHFEQARDRLTEQRYQQYEEQLLAARSHAEGDATLLVEMSGFLLDRDPARAVAVAREALEADASSVEARVALGVALLRLREPAEAAEHLRAAYAATGQGHEAGYSLALALEAAGDLEDAHTVLADLVRRFPGQVEIAQALARLDSVLTVWPAPGRPGTATAEWVKEKRWVTSQVLIGVRSDGQTAEALGRDGAVRWRLTCGGGEITDMLFQGERGIVFTPVQGCLFAPATGKMLGRLPPAEANPWLEGFAWRGDYIAIATDVEPPSPQAAAAYFGTNWSVYRMRDGGAEHLYNAPNGSRRAALSANARTLFTWFGNHGAGRPRLFRDGVLVTDYPGLPVGAEMALDPRDDRFYLVSYNGFVQARSLDGAQVLWQASADQHARPILWAEAIAVRQPDGFSVLDRESGEVLWTGQGWPIESTGDYLLVRNHPEMLLYDMSGQVVGRYPAETGLTHDGKALATFGEDQIVLYRLPGAVE